MQILTGMQKVKLRHRIDRLLGHQSTGSRDFEYRGPEPEPKTDLERLFWQNEGRAIDKWLHYLPIYERHLAPWRGRQLRMLEIGVQNGGSMAMWRKWFGPEAQLWGIDIDPACAKLNGLAGQVRIGSQADPAFLASVLDEMGGVDIVFDDGSHDQRHIHETFKVAFPRLAEGGVYLVEDLHCAYWGPWTGGYGRAESFMETVKTLVDDMHHWYHDFGQQVAPTRNHLAGIHVYDSVVILDKAAVVAPSRTTRGTEFVHGDQGNGSASKAGQGERT